MSEFKNFSFQFFRSKAAQEEERFGRGSGANVRLF